MPVDLAVVGQDPRFGWGARAQLDAFWSASLELDRRPELLYIAHPTLSDRDPGGYRDPGVRGLVRHVDAANQLTGGLRLALRARAARSQWVVATTASHGWAAHRSGRPYAAWIATSLDDEWRGRRLWLSPSRRLALAVNAPVLRRLERTTLRGARIVCATSPTARAGIAAAAGIDPERVRVLPIPVDLDRFTPLPEGEWRENLARPVLAFVGRGDDPRKNVGLLLDALPLIRRRVPEARLLLVGRPPAGPLPEAVHAAGFVDSVGDAIRGAALLVVPSRQEGFGLLAAEALACGVPVLSTPCGGPEEMIRRSGGGRVLESLEAEELAEAAAELLEAPEELAAMRTRGRVYVEAELAPSRFRQRLSQLFQELDDDA